ncbi:MAG: RnfABCDGE type electron transport complex subunit B [Gammaproteobacteria bacterium]|jgi:RnfABCDGE-type electron transport complex B subunit|nr:RnfABCDGE type electron transport complex subunit B [Gammaproteobacteria bacterium]MDP6733309.1 RnfABCDGE type electron transport complex subunit B [Gammaproteobacteria bacterium]
MNSVMIAPAIMAGIGLFFGVIIAFGSRYLRVDEDPRIDGANKLLPGTNCGACGEPGCLPFAEKLVAGSVAPSQCTVSTAEETENIAEYLGVDVGEHDRLVARLKCGGGSVQAHQIAEYQGFEGCRAAAVVSGGGKGCIWGCIGLADCEVSCTFDAIHMNSNGLPQVDTDLCTGCPDCTDACPKDLFELLPISQKLYVECNSPLQGDAATVLCTTACDACGKCALDASPGLITMENGLPVIDYSSGAEASPEAIFRCPTNAIKWVEKNQFEDQEELEIRRERYG